MAYKFLPLSTVKRWEPIAAQFGVSVVARSDRGFLAAYKRAKGKAARLSDDWYFRREDFIKRHMAQVKKREESLWNGGVPTRRHLALIMWAYSPHRSML